MPSQSEYCDVQKRGTRERNAAMAAGQDEMWDECAGAKVLGGGKQSMDGFLDGKHFFGKLNLQIFANGQLTCSLKGV